MASLNSKLKKADRRRDGSLRPTNAKDLVRALRRLTHELEETGIVNHLSRTDSDALEACYSLLSNVRKRAQRNQLISE